ncbi:SH3 domain and tetratricopeptide repeat-containing protein 1 isoform X1 [Anguilla rostrata]|uniref:SH3 domain and tetratricopeptide repeat-containing protein 1 isoform X1 n=1 Tax=Anguilla rostrata TaxID=7938 RepID=UPI0030D5252B
MTTSAHPETIQVGNGLESDFRDYRSTQKEMSAEESCHHDHNMNKGGNSESGEGGLDSPKVAGTVKALSTACEDSFPTALSMRLSVVRGPDRLPDEGLQEVLRGKLRVLEADSGEVTALFSELSARLLSINSEEDVIFVTFKTFEEIWKFSTYYTLGFLGQCMENLLMDQEFWLNSLEQDDPGIEVSVEEETLSLMYKGILMQEGSFFGSCTTNQMFDSSTSGSDLYLEQGDIAMFEPPFLGSGWTVLSLVDGARGTKPKPALEPVDPFHQWFLKACPENILVGSGKLAYDFPFQFAVGSCVATVEYDACGPDELSFDCGDVIQTVGPLASCFEWFLGKHESSGDVGLVKTCLVKPTDSLCESTEAFLDKEDRLLFNMNDKHSRAEMIALLNKTSKSDVGTVYKLDFIEPQDCPGGTNQNGLYNVNASKQEELRSKIDLILSELKGTSSLPAEVAEPCLDDDTPEPAGGDDAPCFIVHLEGDNPSSDGFLPLLMFLNCGDYRAEFSALYDHALPFRDSLFSGHADDDELVSYLGVARETARKKRMFWAQSRICFLLGKMCARKSKFSQARVYFEETLSVVRDLFTDTLLLISVYTNLAVIYLMQKNTEKYFAVSERAAALLMAIPDYVCSTEKEPEVFKYILKKAILAHNMAAEARACFLLSRVYWRLERAQNAVPFLERLQILGEGLPGAGGPALSRCYLALGRLYGEKYLPHLALSAVRRATLQPSAGLAQNLGGIGLVLENAPRLYGVGKQGVPVPAQTAPYLSRALVFASADKDRVLCHALSLCLSQLFQKQGMLGKAIQHVHALIDLGPGASRADATDALVYLAWLHVCNGEHRQALGVLDSLLASTPENCTTPQEGVVYNLRAIALRHSGDVRQASLSYQEAIDICAEFDSRHNWAIALANFGLLCLQAGARTLGESSLVQSLEFFSELADEGHEVNFIAVLLELGQFCVQQGQPEKGKIYYEWALLIAIKSNHSECQLRATRRLCQLYQAICPDEAQCIIYNEHQLTLVRRTGDKSQEGDILQAISQLYLSLGTERAYKSALDYTKRSLGIFIDLRKKEKEAYAWLQAGKIYHILRQNELVDLYIQVAQDSGLSTGNSHFILELLEVAGDVFFNGFREREKAVSFYRDRAFPIAVKTSNSRSQLRLSNKLAELLMQLKLYGEALEFAQAALDISASLGDRLNERVAFHRLATVYHCLGQYELAEHYFLKALSLCPSPLQFDEETLYYVRVYQTLGDIIFYDLKDPHDAAGYYHLALAAAMDLGNKRSQLKLCTRLATIYHNFLLDRELSLFFYQKARAFATELNVRRINLSPDQNFHSTSHYKTAATAAP